jgi:hypothetical protein
MVAIKYQIVIMLTILAVMTIGSTLSIVITVNRSFDKWGILRKDIFKPTKRQTRNKEIASKNNK